METHEEGEERANRGERRGWGEEEKEEADANRKREEQEESAGASDAVAEVEEEAEMVKQTVWKDQKRSERRRK